ncbi:hypothetical protein [Microcoleus sp. herbarium2]|uniref:hypothetical protein n=1 Tax=Microcoleus sp. herbarium2 TaxID=3055433 RepID=UPI002FD61011
MLINPSQLLDWKQYQFFNRPIGKLTEYFVFPFGQPCSEGSVRDETQGSVGCPRRMRLAIGMSEDVSQN